MPVSCRVAVIGLGKLGTCLAAFLASKGLDVIGVDVERETVARLNRGQTALKEPGLGELITAHRDRLRATHDYGQAVANSEVTFIIVPTPSEPDGGFSLRFVAQAAREIGRSLATKAGYHLVVLTSTVVPGSTVGRIRPILEEASGKACGEDFGLCYNPAFISLGSVLRDLVRPDFVLIGQSDERAGRQLEEIHRSLCGASVPIVRMNIVNAELTKLAVNTFVTTKISFANMLAQLCEQLPDADIDVVTGALGLDARIGRRYLTGALGYGGPCFPRDNQALIALARQLGRPSFIAEATDQLNRAYHEGVLERIQSFLTPGMTIGVLGLAYKPLTDVVDESPGLSLAQRFSAAGYRVVVCDPLAMDRARSVLGGSVSYAGSPKDCIAEADAVIFTTPAQEFARLEADDFPVRERGMIVFDPWRILRKQLSGVAHLTYVPLGVGPHQASVGAPSDDIRSPVA